MNSINKNFKNSGINIPLDFTLRNFLVKFKNLPFLKGDKSKNCYILNMSTENMAKHKAKELSGALKNIQLWKQ